MKKVILTIGILAGVSSTFAQVGRVGINTDDPKATLHIKADKNNKDNNPGLIIPDVSKDKLDTGEPVESTLVYYSDGSNSAYINQNTGSTTENIGSKKGFYYYDGTDWQRIIRKAQFYMPSIVTPTTVGTHKIDLYEEYIKQYADSNGTNTSNGQAPSRSWNIQTNNSNNSLKTYKRDDLDYFVVYYDNNVFTELSITGDEDTEKGAGVLEYTVTDQSAKNISAQTFMNIVLQER